MARLEAGSEETDTETIGADTVAVVVAVTRTAATVATATATTVVVAATTVATVTTVADTTEDTATTAEATTVATVMIVEATTAETEILRAVVVESTDMPLLDAMTATAAVEEAHDSTVLLLAMRPRLAATARVRVTIPCPAMVVTELSRCRPPCALSNFSAGIAPRCCVHGRSSRLLWSYGGCTPCSFSSFMGKGVGRISKEQFATEEFCTAQH